MYKSIALIFLISLFFTLNSLAAENLFEKNYQSQSPKGFQSLIQSPDTKIIRGWDRKQDMIKMLEKGYDFMGFSGFTSLNLSPDLALEHGRKIKADLLLIYDRQINESNRASRISAARKKAKEANRIKESENITEIEITEKDLIEPSARYDFYVTYWVKLPKPTFGAHFIKLRSTDSQNNNNGVKIIAVIENSPAANAGILKDDSITTIDDVIVNTPDDLIKLIRNKKGRDIQVIYLRNGKSFKITVNM